MVEYKYTGVKYAELKKFFAQNDDEWARLERIVKLDKQPKPRGLDGIYLVAGTKDTGNFRGSMREPLARTAELLLTAYAPIILILRGTTEHGYAGYDYAKEELRKLLVPEERIQPVDLLPDDEEKKELNTYTETRALTAYCQNHELRAIYVVDAWFHQMRASTTIISNLARENPELWIFNKVAEPPHWNVPILHSQGELADILPILDIREKARLFEYHDKEFLISCADALEYYRKRDQAFGL